MNEGNIIMCRVFSPVFGEVPDCEWKSSEVQARAIVEELEAARGAKKILYFRTNDKCPWIALNMSRFVLFEWRPGELCLFFS